MVVYWYGTTVLAGASLSERLTQTWAVIDTTPSSAKRPMSRGDGVTQASGAQTAPNSSAATVCVVTSTVSPVPRSTRVESIESENVKLPASAISAGQPSTPEPGRRQTMTPMK